MENIWLKFCQLFGKGKKNSKSEQKKVGKGAGKKITKQTSSAEVPTCGYLNVLSNNRWQKRWCRLKDNQLLLHTDQDDLKSHIASLTLPGCKVNPGLDHKHPFAFRLLRNSQEVVVLEASSPEEMGRWLVALLAETGSTMDPAPLHYNYVDLESIQLTQPSFCFTSNRSVSASPFNVPSCPTGMAVHSAVAPINRTEQCSGSSTEGHQLNKDLHYEDTHIYENIPSPKLAARYHPKPPASSTPSSSYYQTPLSNIKFLSTDSKTEDAAQLKGKKATTISGASNKKTDPKKNGVNKTNGKASLERNNSSEEQCKYGKNRVTADAKRLQTKEEELIRKKQEIRNHLTQLKKKRRELRAAVEAPTEKQSHAFLSEQLKKVEEDCKQKEEEQVKLELELRKVKESTKKALSGGVTLGLTFEPKAGSSHLLSPSMLRQAKQPFPFSSCDTSDTESCSLPVNSTLLLHWQRGGQKPSPARGHVLRKAKEWEQKSST